MGSLTCGGLYSLMARRSLNKTVADITIYLYLTALMGAVGAGSLHAGEEVIILGKGKTAELAEWDKPVHFGTGDWKVVDDAEDQALKLRADSSSFALEKSITVDLSRTPFLEWEWKVTVPPAGGDFSSPDTDDQAAQLLVVFPKTFFERRKIINLYLGPDCTTGDDLVCRRTGLPQCEGDRGRIRRRSELGLWIIEKRNVAHDFLVLYGEIPEHAVAIRLQINSQHTQSVAEAFWRTIRFTSD